MTTNSSATLIKNTHFQFRRHAAALRFPCALFAAAALATSAFGADEILARVSGTDVKVDEIRPLLEKLAPREQAALESNPAELTQAVRALLTSRVVLAEAVAQKWDKNPAFTAQLDKLREQALVESYLQSVSEPPMDFPSEADVKAAYEAHKTALVAPRQIHLAQIFIAAPTGTTASDAAELKKAQIKLDSVTKQLGQSGADFAAIARADSDEKQNAAKGGELGWLTEAQLRPEIKDTVTALSAGGVSKPIRLADGWHILKATEIRESHQLAFDEVQAELSQRIRAERAKSNRQAYLARLVEKNPITINELAVSQILAPAANAAGK